LLEKLSAELPNSIAVPADMTKIPQIINMVGETVEHFGRVDILINNAGQGYDAPVEKIDISTFNYIFDLNVVGPLVAMQQVIPIMRRQGKGIIINVSSATALMYLQNMSAYSASKRALVGISLTAREVLLEDNITVGVVYPYITLTEFRDTLNYLADRIETLLGSDDLIVTYHLRWDGQGDAEEGKRGFHPGQECSDNGGNRCCW
jgi:short-subunit dehydrogenase